MPFEFPCDLLPRVVGFDERPAGVPNRLPPGWVAEKRDDGIRKIARLVRCDELAPGRHGEPFGADGRRDDGLAHGERFEDLEARATARSQRDHE